MKPHRRIQRRFILAVAAAILFLSIFAATIPRWYWQWPSVLRRGNQPSSLTMLAFGGESSGSTMGSHEGMLIASHLIIPPKPPTAPGDPPDIVVFSGPADIVEKEFWENAYVTFNAVYATTCSTQHIGPNGWVFGCRLWLVRCILAAPLALMLWAAWHTRPRPGIGQCQKCGYNRAGLAPTSVCPECGTPPR